MKTSNIGTVTALAQLRDYAKREQDSSEHLSARITEKAKGRRFTAQERRDIGEYESSATAYWDMVRAIEAKIIEVVNEE